jgi:hypothetical protein
MRVKTPRYYLVPRPSLSNVLSFKKSINGRQHDTRSASNTVLVLVLYCSKARRESEDEIAKNQQGDDEVMEEE